jgi:hypothetical protein
MPYEKPGTDMREEIEYPAYKYEKWRMERGI